MLRLVENESRDGADYRHDDPLFSGFQLPTFPAAPISAPISISVNRESPRQMTVLPGGGSFERAR